MARSLVILSVAAVAVLAFQMSQTVSGQGQGLSCTTNATCNACPQGIATCCDGFTYGQSKDGNVWALSSGHCRCCRSGEKCDIKGGWAYGSTTHTDSNALVFMYACLKK